jgi:monothiol bacilliredoxin
MFNLGQVPGICSEFVWSESVSYYPDSNLPGSKNSMDTPFVTVTDTQSLQELLNRSRERPVVIFKHSTTCPISASAYREMAELEGEVALVEVQRARDLSREIENRTGIEHESPQVIVLRNGKVVWNGSHWNVKADAVAEAVRENL